MGNSPSRWRLRDVPKAQSRGSTAVGLHQKMVGPTPTHVLSYNPVRLIQGWRASVLARRQEHGGVVVFPVIVIFQQEVSPMNAVSALGAPLESTIARHR